MTNILAAIVVTVVTNSVEKFPSHYEYESCNHPKPCSLAHGAFMKEVPNANPTMKQVTTTCKEVTTLRFDWNGPREIVQERVLWQTNVVYALQSNWAPTTNAFPNVEQWHGITLREL